MKTVQIQPSILAADKGYLAAECQRAAAAGADGLHVDVMDGHFVPNLSMGSEFVTVAQKAAPQLHRSVHLMITRPDTYADQFIDAGADTLQIQVESDCDVAATLQHIRDRGIRSGLVINPDTTVEDALAYEELFDELLLMSVHPGFGGQSFIVPVLDKIREARAALPDRDISVDGGVDGTTGLDCIEAGANILIAGSYLFKAPDMAEAIARMRAKAKARP